MIAIYIAIGILLTPVFSVIMIKIVCGDKKTDATDTGFGSVVGCLLSVGWPLSLIFIVNLYIVKAYFEVADQKKK